LEETDIDPQEVANTPIAKRLTELGFREDPKGSGLYCVGKVELGKAMGLLRLAETDLRQPPNCGPLDWVRTANLEGNPCVFRATFEKLGEKPTPQMPVGVTVNLGYIRPRSVFVGMPVERLIAALEHLGAKEVKREGNATLPEALLTSESRVYCAVLPDGVPLVATWVAEPRLHGEKPSLPKVTALFVGKPDRGFEGWKPGEAESVKIVPVMRYRAKHPEQ
jgi:hypothetical protein